MYSKCSFSICQFELSTDGEPFCEQSVVVPFGLIAVGTALARAVPSVLDYFSQSDDFIVDYWVDWMPAVNDLASDVVLPSAHVRMFALQAQQVALSVLVCSN